MQPPLVQFTLRRMMIAVILMGLLLGGVRLMALSTAYRSRAQDFTLKAEMAEFDAAIFTATGIPGYLSDPIHLGDAELYSGYQRRTAHYRRLVKKYMILGEDCTGFPRLPESTSRAVGRLQESLIAGGAKMRIADSNKLRGETTLHLHARTSGDRLRRFTRTRSERTTSRGP